MPIKQTVRRWLKNTQQLPLEIIIPTAVLTLLIVFYGLAFLVDKQVTLSYSGPTCVRQLTLFPGLHQVAGESDYSAKVSDKFTVGGVTIAAFSMCFTPEKAPQPGVSQVSTSPFGSWFARKSFAIKIEAPPVAALDPLAKPIPISRPLTLQLTNTDQIFSYKLKIGEARADCRPLDAKLACAVDTLNLTQGQTYSAEFERYFDSTKIASVAKKEVAILSATKLMDSSIKPSELVYAKPRTMTMAFDKKLVEASPSLYKVEGEKRTKVAITSKIAETGLEITMTDELARSADYVVTLEDVVASDGSSLEEKVYELPFKTSGGPKVTGVNVGTASVSMGTTVVVTFDQPLSEKQDIGKFLALSGGASFAGKRGNQLLISLGGVPKCGDFGIKITNDLQSNYDIGGNSAWSFAGRTICYTIGTIGYSSKGRAINAYYFGNGPRTVLFTGAIHGSESSTKSLMDRWIQDLEANARKIPADKQIVVVPAINPDGIASGSRTNARNVDLNRNFATGDWRTDVTDVNNRPFPGGGGPSPMSEPETNAIAGLAQRLRPMLILSYHSIGGIVAANQTGGSAGFASTYSQLSGYRNTTGQTSDTFEYGISGTADDWYGERLGVASVLIELGSHSYHQFDRNQRAMWAMVNG